MYETRDFNYAAFLIFLEKDFTYEVRESRGRKEVYFRFPDVTTAESVSLFMQLANSPLRKFVDAQRVIKNVIRSALAG